LGKPVSREYIRQLCDAGTIQASKPGRDWLISETAGNAWLFVWLRG
jgi:excisionase family DNA binding protein